LHPRSQRVTALIDETGQRGEGNNIGAELSPFTTVGISLLPPEDVQRSDECCTLSAVVVETEQLEARVAGGAKVPFNLVFVCEDLQPAACLKELLSLTAHAVMAKQISKDVEVVSTVSASILTALFEVGEGAPLSLLVGDDRAAHGRFPMIVAREGDLCSIVVIRMGRMLIPVESACSRLDMKLAAVVPLPSAADARSGIDMSRIIFLHVCHPSVAPFDPVARRLIACRHHQERRMVAIGVSDGARL
jgi:hypothetical protein